MLLNGILTNMKGAGKIDYPSKNIKSTIDNGIKSAKSQTAKGVLFVFDEMDYTTYDLEKEKEKLKSVLLSKRVANPDFVIRCYLFGIPPIKKTAQALRLGGVGIASPSSYLLQIYHLYEIAQLITK